MPDRSEIPKIEEFFTAEKVGVLSPKAEASRELTRLYAKELITSASGEDIANSKDGRSLLAEMLATSFAEADFLKLITEIEAKGRSGEAKMSTTFRPATPKEFDQSAQIEITKQ